MPTQVLCDTEVHSYFDILNYLLTISFGFFGSERWGANQRIPLDHAIAEMATLSPYVYTHIAKTAPHNLKNMNTIIIIGSPDSSVSIVTSYGLDGRGSIPSSETHPASYPRCTGGCLLGVKRQGSELVHSSPTTAEVKNGGAIPTFPHISS
jgi:hypothetical protein